MMFNNATNFYRKFGERSGGNCGAPLLATTVAKSLHSK
jgi:hypothetical protein